MFRGLARYRREFTETATRLCSPHKGTLATEDVNNLLEIILANQFPWKIVEIVSTLRRIQ